MDQVNDYVVAVPSYQRAATLATKTLPLLTSRGIDPARITVFVADNIERAMYSATVPRNLYGDLIVSAPGLGNSRNFINDYYPPGTSVLCADDDLTDVLWATGSRSGRPAGLEPVPDIAALATECFAQMQARRLTLWGVYPVANAYFMRHALTTDLRYIVGCFYGTVTSRGPQNYVTLEDKEDFERTILHYLHAGGVLRRSDITVKTRYYDEPGGMQVTRTRGRIEASARDLTRRFPDLCTLNHTKASGHLEVRLRDKRPKVPA